MSIITGTHLVLYLSIQLSESHLGSLSKSHNISSIRYLKCKLSHFLGYRTLETSTKWNAFINRHWRILSFILPFYLMQLRSLCYHSTNSLIFLVNAHIFWKWARQEDYHYNYIILLTGLIMYTFYQEIWKKKVQFF